MTASYSLQSSLWVEETAEQTVTFPPAVLPNHLGLLGITEADLTPLTALFTLVMPTPTTNTRRRRRRGEFNATEGMALAAKRTASYRLKLCRTRASLGLLIRAPDVRGGAAASGAGPSYRKLAGGSSVGHLRMLGGP